MSESVFAPPYIDDLLQRLEEFRRAYRPLVDEMPDVTVGLTQAQERLRSEHGTPKEFGEALLNAIGQISGSEAVFHMRRYKAEWEAAGKLA